MCSSSTRRPSERSRTSNSTSRTSRPFGLLLSGGSVIDWQRVAFASKESVDRFLGLHLIDLDDPVDRERLRYVFNEAMSYLEEHLHLRFPEEIRDPDDVRDIFLYASETGGFRRRQILSCVVLKLMHVIHHMESADLKFKSPVAEEELIDVAEARILRAARKMRGRGPARGVLLRVAQDPQLDHHQAHREEGEPRRHHLRQAALSHRRGDAGRPDPRARLPHARGVSPSTT